MVVFGRSTVILEVVWRVARRRGGSAGVHRESGGVSFVVSSRHPRRKLPHGGTDGYGEVEGRLSAVAVVGGYHDVGNAGAIIRMGR